MQQTSLFFPLLLLYLLEENNFYLPLWCHYVGQTDQQPVKLSKVGEHQ